MKLELPERKVTAPPQSASDHIASDASKYDAKPDPDPEPNPLGPLGPLDPILEDAVQSQPDIPPDTLEQPQPETLPDPEPTRDDDKPQPRSAAVISLGWIAAGLAGIAVVAASLLLRQPQPRAETQTHYGPVPTPERIVIE